MKNSNIRKFLQPLLIAALVTFSLLTKAQSLIKYVNPFIGTGAHGHTYPGATVPFGMVQLSPDNGTQGWDWCSGYHYSDSMIAGFSHTHLSGTGIGDLCDIFVMPANPSGGQYVFASPHFDEVKFNLAGNKSFVIRAKNAGKDRPYIQSVQLNNKPYNSTYIDHTTLINGGVLEFIMGEKPNKEFGQLPATWPLSSSFD